MSRSHASVAEDPVASQREQSRHNRRKWLAIIGFSLLGLLAAGLVVLARHWPFSQQRVVQALQEDFHGTVTFSSFHPTVFPYPGCVAEGATLVRPGAGANSRPLASAQKLIIRARYIDLLARPGFIARIEVRGLQIHVPPVGTMPALPHSQNPSSTRLGEVVANNSLLEIARKDGEPLRFQTHRLTLNSVSRKEAMTYDVALLNALPPGEIQSHGHFGPWNSDDPGQTPVSGTYRFEHAYLGVFRGIDGVLNSHDNYQGTLGKIETHGSLEVPDFKVWRAGRSTPLVSRFDALVNALNGDVHLEHVETRIVKTNVLARGAIEEVPGPSRKTTSVDLNVSHGRIQDVLRLFIKEPRSPIVGTTSFQAHATIPPQGRPFEQEIELTGDFGIDDSHFTKTETQKKVEELSERSQGKKVDDKAKAEADDEEDASRAISDLKGHVVLKNGLATLTDISFSIPGATAYMHGTFNLLNEKLDFHGVLKTQAEFSKVGGGGIKSIFLKPLDAVFKKKPKGAEVPVKMTGTYSHPEFGLEITGGQKDTKD
jgi:AsmA-like C-terminal region